MRDRFLQAARVGLDAVADDRVGAAWNRPSALADQTVGALAAHLARAALTVDRYLDEPAPDPADVDRESGGHYFSAILGTMTDDDHAAVRSRSAELGDLGRDAVIEELRRCVDNLTTRLPNEPGDRVLRVAGGAVMRLDDYLVTRMVELVVHLDDLARSLDVTPWSVPTAVEDVVLACGAEIGRRRRGTPAMVRALFRDAEPGTLPVL